MRPALGEKPCSHASEKNITALSTEPEARRLNPFTVNKQWKHCRLSLFTSKRSVKKTARGGLDTNPIKKACSFYVAVGGDMDEFPPLDSKVKIYSTVNEGLLFKDTEGSYGHRMSFLYLRTRHTAVIRVMTLTGHLIKSSDPFMSMSNKSGFTASADGVLYEPQWGSWPIRRREGVSTSQSPWGRPCFSFQGC